MSIDRSPYGQTPQGEPVELITMRNSGGASVSLMTLGGTLTSIIVPDKHGIYADVCLGYKEPADYARASGYLGALIGRYANRIAGGRLPVDGTVYQLNLNEKQNHLHGGLVGFDKYVWQAQVREGEGEDSVTFTRVSPDGEEHYPGELKVSVTYTFNDENELSLHYAAACDQDTYVNLTNHVYFNLAGHASGTIHNHEMQIFADAYTPIDASFIPTGEVAPVDHTPFDLREPRRIGDGLAQTDSNEQLRLAGGYDHNFIIDHEADGINKAGELYDPASGRVLETFTSMPGIQFYAGNMLDVSFPAKDGAHYGPHCGLCLETQYFPNTPNVPAFPSCLLRAGEVYDHTTVYRFSVRGQ